MMMNSKQFATAFLVLAVSVGQFAFVPNAFAVNEATFCTNIDAAITKIKTTFDERQAQFQAKEKGQLSTLQARWTDIDQKRSNDNSATDKKRDEVFAKLEAKVVTEEQRTAVTIFETAIRSAVNAHRTSIREAVAMHRASVTKLLTDAATPNDKLVNNLKNDFDTAIRKAKADCANGIAPQTIKNELRDSLKIAKESLQQNIKNDTINKNMESISADRAKNVAIADATFKKAIAEAKKAVLEAFK